MTGIAQWVVPLAPEEVERAHWSLLALVSYPNEVIEVAGELAAVMREHPDCGARLEPLVARLAQGSKLAHERADWLFERAQKGTLHEAKGGIQ